MTQRPDRLVAQVRKYFMPGITHPADMQPADSHGPWAWYCNGNPRNDFDIGISVTGGRDGAYSAGLFVDSTYYHLSGTYANTDASAEALLSDLEERFKISRMCIALETV